MHPRVAGPLGKVKRHPGFTLYALDDNSTRAVIYIDRRLTASATNAPKPALVSATMNGLTITNVYLHPNFDLATDTWLQLRSLPP